MERMEGLAVALIVGLVAGCGLVSTAAQVVPTGRACPFAEFD